MLLKIMGNHLLNPSSLFYLLIYNWFLQGNEIYKTVFVAFFQGEQLKSRVKKVCSGYHASFYNCPSSFAERQDLLKGVKTRIEDLNLVRNEYIMYFYFVLQ